MKMIRLKYQYSTIIILLAICIVEHFQPSSSFVYQSNSVIHNNRFEIKDIKDVITNKVRGGSDSGSNIRAQSGSDANSDIVAKVPPAQPTLQELLKFALPCLGLWISGPLLSLVDTAAVGLTAKPGMGALELGALGPATTFIDGATYLFAFLNVATTNLYASALAQNAGDEAKSKCATDAVVRTAGKISIICGIGIMVLLWTKGEFLLSLYIGGGESSAKIIGPAARYIKARSLSMPTSLLYGVIQAALLGAKDSVTPLIAVLVATVFNVVGDGLLVVLLKWGTYGAAIATTVAQWAGTAAMWRPAKNKLLHKSTPEERAKHKVTSKDFLSFAAPVLTLILGKLAAFGVMTHVAASLPGEAVLAGHQIILSLFLFISPFLEVISQTAQTFLPQYYVEQSPLFHAEGQALAIRLLRLGVSVGACVAVLAAIIPRFIPFILTNDASVMASVKPLAMPLFLGALLTAPVAISEGILLARRQLKYLASVYVLSTIAFPYFLFKLKTSGGSVSNVWYGFVVFQLFRASCFVGKIWGRTILQKLSTFFRIGLKKQPLDIATEVSH